MSPPPETGAPPAPVRQRSLGWRLVWATLVFCALFILASVMALTWSAWNEGLSRMDAELAQIEQIYGDTLSKAIWELDREALQAQVHSAKGIPAVGKIVLKVTLANRPPEIFESAHESWSAVTGPVATVFMAVLLGGRLVSTTRRIERFNDELGIAVKDAQGKLAQVLAQAHDQALQHAKLQERTQIAHDLHDGLGGSLVRSMALVELSPQPLSNQRVLSLLKLLRDD